MESIDVSKIKLVIWDLDDTFWKGTLSEEQISPIEENVELVKALTHRGIVNAICSKNDQEPVEHELDKLGVKGYFVFNSINWQPKGQRIAEMIKTMGLRPVNVLFLDDNQQNLQEAKYYSPDLMIGCNDAIAVLREYVATTGETDSTLKRLKQYQVLEEKQQAKASFSSNNDFLFDSNTRVEIIKDCMPQIDRIHELLMRSNQLNYTKKRIPKEELAAAIEDEETDCGYVTVRDKYGDYGIVGFYALKGGQLIHFFFSCRTIGQGVEQYVYAKLGHPKLEVTGDVISQVDDSEAPAWINQKNGNREVEEAQGEKKDIQILLKGPCDLLTIVTYLKKAASVDYEFDYVSDSRHNLISQQSHSLTIVQSKELTEEEKTGILEDYIFTDEKMFDTHLFDGNYDLVFLSTLRESTMGIYQNKKTGLKAAFGKFFCPLTDEKNWPQYLNKEVDCQQNDFTREWIKEFSTKHDYLGAISLDEYKKNVEYILKNTPKKTKICFLLGAEKLFVESSDFDRTVAAKHKLFNDYLKQLAQSNERVLVLDVDKYITSFSDYTDRIEHYTRMIYYKLANEIIEIIAKESGSEIQGVSKLTAWLDNVLVPIGQKMNHDSRFFKYIRATYYGIRNMIFK